MSVGSYVTPQVFLLLYAKEDEHFWNGDELGEGEHLRNAHPSGGEIHEVKEAARHKDIRTTERYMTAREDRVKALMGKMAARSA